MAITSLCQGWWDGRETERGSHHAAFNYPDLRRRLPHDISYPGYPFLRSTLRISFAGMRLGRLGHTRTARFASMWAAMRAFCRITIGAKTPDRRPALIVKRDGWEERLIRCSRSIPSAISASNESAMRSLETLRKTVTLNKRGSGVVGLAAQKVAEKRYAVVREVCLNLFPICACCVRDFAVPVFAENGPQSRRKPSRSGA